MLSEKARQLQGSNWIYSHTANYYNDTGFVTGTTTVPATLTGATGTGSSTGMQLYYSQTKNWSNGTTVGGTGVPAYGGSNDTAMGDYSSKNWVSFSERYGWLQAKQDFVNQYGTGTSSYQYDAEGFLHKVDRTITGNALAEDVYFANDINGLVLRRWEERDPGYAAGAVLPSVTTYRFGGKEMGTVGNNGTTNVDYATLIDRRDDVQGSGRFLGGATTASAYSNFDANLVTLAGGAQDNVPGSWTVRAGDTLQSIALASWGDASQWYKIALANGLAGSGAIAEGQTLVIPGAVGNIHNNADTLKPYDPARALGDVSPPGAKPPPQKRGCGIVGMILLAVVGVAVAVATAGTLAAASIAAAGGQSVTLGMGISAAFGGTVAGGFGLTTVGMMAVGAGAAAASSVVTQALSGNGISWKGVGLAALGGAIGGALGPKGLFGGDGLFGGIGNNTAAAALRGAAGSALTQGIGVATHLQDSFNWAGVAAAGVAAGIGYQARSILGAEDLSRNATIGNHFANIGASAAATIASAATRSAIEGTSFGDNILAGLPDVIAQLFSNLAINGIDLPEEEIDGSPVANDGKASASRNGLTVFNPHTGQHRMSGGKSFDAVWDDWIPEPIKEWIPEPIKKWMGEKEEQVGNLDDIVVTAKSWATWAVDKAVQEIPKAIARVTAMANNNYFTSGSGAFVMTDKMAYARGRGELNGLKDSAISGARDIFALAETVNNPAEQLRTAVYAWRGAYAVAQDTRIVTRPIKAEYNRVSNLKGEARAEAEAYWGTRAVAEIMPLVLGGEALVPGRVAGVTERTVLRLEAEGLQAAKTAPEFVGPLIGKSGFRTSGEFAEAVGTRYQGFVDDAYVAAQRLETKGLLRGNPNTRVGNYVDRISARDLKAYLQSEGVSEGRGSLVQMNRWLRDPGGSGLYVRPDVRIPAAGRIYDATVSFKAYDDVQIVRFGQYSGGNRITVVRPSSIGSYSIAP